MSYTSTLVLLLHLIYLSYLSNVYRACSFFTNSELFCIDNARVIYRNIRCVYIYCTPYVLYILIIINIFHLTIINKFLVTVPSFVSYSSSVGYDNNVTRLSTFSFPLSFMVGHQVFLSYNVHLFRIYLTIQSVAQNIQCHVVG
jgi:hypothetical protein